IDLTKPFDPIRGQTVPVGTDAKIEKGKQGQETITANGKKYACTWTSYKVKGKAKGKDVDADVRVWTAKEVPTGLVRMTVTYPLGETRAELTRELEEIGTKN